MYDEKTLQQKIAEARARGVGEDLIQARVNELKSNGQIISEPQVSTPQPSLTERVGQGVIDIGKRIVKPFVSTAKNIGATSTIPQAILATIASKISPEYGAKIASQNVGTQQRAGAIAENPEEEVRKQLLNSAEVASYAVPFGKGKNILTKATLPGAVVGGVSAANEEGATLPSIAGGAILGGVAGTAMHAVSKIPSIVKGAGEGIEKVGTSTRAGVSRIKVKPSVYGASKEKAIEKTLDDLGIRGTAAQKYGQLEPKMNELGQKISQELTNNPKVLSKKSVIESFMNNLKDLLRRKEINSAVAQKEISGYVDDILATRSGGKFTSKITNQDIFNLKKLVNEDFQIVAKKIQANVPLSDREKIVSIARKTLDEIISRENPTVKTLTTQQSHLYDAAVSLARSRSVTPTTRIAGTTVPTNITQAIQDKAGRVMQGTGKYVAGAGGMLPDITPNQTLVNIAGQVSSRLPDLSANVPQPTQEGYPGESNITKDNQGYNIQGQMDHTLPSITPEVQEPQSYLTGYSPEQLYSAYQQALADDNAPAAKELRQMFIDETAYQKDNAPAKKPKLSEADKKFQFAGDEARKALTALDKTKDIPVGIISGSTIAQKARQLTGRQTDEEANFLSKLAISRTAARNALLGANMSDKEIQSLLEFTFDASLPREVLRQRIVSFIDSMDSYMSNIAGPTNEFDYTLPNITQ